MRKWSVLLILPSEARDLNSNSNEVAMPGNGLTAKLDDRDGSVVFHNGGSKPLYILKPLDGFVDCRQISYYHFAVRDPNGKPLEFRPGCALSGLWAGTKWPQDYLVEIKPDASYSVGIWLDGYFRFERNGPHTISFEYVYQPTEDSLAPSPQPWRGAIAAPSIVMTYKPELRLP
jgi:hypothetical protein